MDIITSVLDSGIAPTISFCGAVPWYLWCRRRPKSGFFRWLFRP